MMLLCKYSLDYVFRLLEGNQKAVTGAGISDRACKWVTIHGATGADWGQVLAANAMATTILID